MTEASPSRHQPYVTVTKLGLGIGWEESIPSGLISPLYEQNFWVGTFRVQRRVNRYAQTHALLDRVGEGMETASRLQVSRARCRRCRVDGYERRKVAHRFTQQRCHTCNACLATHALHARPGCLAKHASHAVIAPCFSAQKAVYLRKSSFSVRLMSRRDMTDRRSEYLRARLHWRKRQSFEPLLGC